MRDGDAHDVVVVGAGLGGLTAGAKLGLEGKDVLVLEQHSVPGGCSTTFERLDFEFEVSLHEIDGLDEQDPKVAIFEELGLLEALDLEPIPEFFRFRHDDHDIVVPHEREPAVERLQARFPAEADAIGEYYDVILEIRNAIFEYGASNDSSALDNPALLTYWDATLGEFLDDLFETEALKLILAGNLGYYHDDPYSMALPYFAAGNGSYIAGGGYYVKGGSQALADHLAGLIERNGGTVETGRLVTDIEIEAGHATGVRHERSRDGKPTGTGDDVRTSGAETVIANAALPLVADELLPDPYGTELRAQFDSWEIAPALTTLYIGFDTPPAELGCDTYSTFISHPSVETLADVATAQRASFGQRGLCFVDYSQIDADLAPEGSAVGIVTTLDYVDEWTGLTDAEYRVKKEYVTDVLLRRLGEVYPALPDAVEHAELATPKTIERYTLNPGGTAYGFAQTPSQTFTNRQFDAPLPNLAFASAWTFPGGGFSGAITSGYGAARSVLSEGA